MSRINLWAGLIPYEICERGYIQAFLLAAGGWLAVLGTSLACRGITRIPAFMFISCSPFGYVSVQIFPFYKGTNRIGLGAQHITLYLNSLYLQQLYFQIS